MRECSSCYSRRNELVECRCKTVFCKLCLPAHEKLCPEIKCARCNLKGLYLNACRSCNFLFCYGCRSTHELSCDYARASQPNSFSERPAFQSNGGFSEKRALRLVNKGMTCYLNASLQVLYACYLAKPSCIPQQSALGRFFTNRITLDEFLQYYRSIMPTFRFNVMFDAAVCAQALLDSLSESGRLEFAVRIRGNDMDFNMIPLGRDKRVPLEKQIHDFVGLAGKGESVTSSGDLLLLHLGGQLAIHHYPWDRASGVTFHNKRWTLLAAAVTGGAHYTALTKCDDKWLICDDEHLTVVSLQSAQQHVEFKKCGWLALQWCKEPPMQESNWSGRNGDTRPPPGRNPPPKPTCKSCDKVQELAACRDCQLLVCVGCTYTHTCPKRNEQVSQRPQPFPNEHAKHRLPDTCPECLQFIANQRCAGCFKILCSGCLKMHRPTCAQQTTACAFCYRWIASTKCACTCDFCDSCLALHQPKCHHVAKCQFCVDKAQEIFSCHLCRLLVCVGCNNTHSCPKRNEQKQRESQPNASSSEKPIPQKERESQHNASSSEKPIPQKERESQPNASSSEKPIPQAKTVIEDAASTKTVNADSATPFVNPDWVCDRCPSTGKDAPWKIPHSCDCCGAPSCKVECLDLHRKTGCRRSTASFAPMEVPKGDGPEFYISRSHLLAVLHVFAACHAAQPGCIPHSELREVVERKFQDEVHDFLATRDVKQSPAQFVQALLDELLDVHGHLPDFAMRFVGEKEWAHSIKTGQFDREFVARLRGSKVHRSSRFLILTAEDGALTRGLWNSYPWDRESPLEFNDQTWVLCGMVLGSKPSVAVVQIKDSWSSQFWICDRQPKKCDKADAERFANESKCWVLVFQNLR